MVIIMYAHPEISRPSLNEVGVPPHNDIIPINISDYNAISLRLRSQLDTFQSTINKTSSPHKHSKLLLTINLIFLEYFILLTQSNNVLVNKKQDILQQINSIKLFYQKNLSDLLLLYYLMAKQKISSKEINFFKHLTLLLKYILLAPAEEIFLDLITPSANQNQFTWIMSQLNKNILSLNLTLSIIDINFHPLENNIISAAFKERLLSNLKKIPPEQYAHTLSSIFSFNNKNIILRISNFVWREFGRNSCIALRNFLFLSLIMDLGAFYGHIGVILPYLVWAAPLLLSVGYLPMLFQQYSKRTYNMLSIFHSESQHTLLILLSLVRLGFTSVIKLNDFLLLATIRLIAFSTLTVSFTSFMNMFVNTQHVSYDLAYEINTPLIMALALSAILLTLPALLRINFTKQEKDSLKTGILHTLNKTYFFSTPHQYIIHYKKYLERFAENTKTRKIITLLKLIPNTFFYVFFGSIIATIPDSIRRMVMDRMLFDSETGMKNIIIIIVNTIASIAVGLLPRISCTIIPRIYRFTHPPAKDFSSIHSLQPSNFMKTSPHHSITNFENKSVLTISIIAGTLTFINSLWVLSNNHSLAEHFTNNYSIFVIAIIAIILFLHLALFCLGLSCIPYTNVNSFSDFDNTLSPEITLHKIETLEDESRLTEMEDDTKLSNRVLHSATSTDTPSTWRSFVNSPASSIHSYIGSTVDSWNTSSTSAPQQEHLVNTVSEPENLKTTTTHISTPNIRQ